MDMFSITATVLGIYKRGPWHEFHFTFTSSDSRSCQRVRGSCQVRLGRSALILLQEKSHTKKQITKKPKEDCSKRSKGSKHER